MTRFSYALATTIAAACTMAALVSPGTTSALETRSSRTVSPSLDTLSANVNAGLPLILALPEDATYEIVRSPALSWLIQRSFFWDTQPADTGRTEILLKRSLGERVDTLHVFITVH